MAEKTGTLYIVATPIGNLEDITQRALRTLREVGLIAAEDTRVTRKLLSRYDIHTPMIAYHQHSRGKRAEEILGRLLSGQDVALVSDAGTPGISDPGHELIRLAIDAAIPIVPIPGANAATTALVISGLPTAHFAFDGFPPRSQEARRTFFRGLKSDPRTVVLYESPLRTVTTLRSALAELGDRRVAVARELTKIHEEVFRGTLGEAVDRFTERKPRGEIVIVIDGASAEEMAAPEVGAADLAQLLAKRMQDGLSERDAVRQVAAELKLPRREVYAAALKLKTE